MKQVARRTFEGAANTNKRDMKIASRVVSPDVVKQWVIYLFATIIIYLPKNVPLSILLTP